ncbi:hypothetical protein BDB00DRAFT_757971, partial [Zychaea mexicana]|uniref:uncharacterized protein n=1 Tax=Zychaea mexicana TaxID=64656 RepID=UPI0022FE0B6B
GSLLIWCCFWGGVYDEPLAITNGSVGQGAYTNCLPNKFSVIFQTLEAEHHERTFIS